VPRAKQRTPELRGHVVDVAVATVADHGVAGFTTRGLAAAAGTSVPAVYELFGDRAGVLRAVFFEGFRRLGDLLAGLEDTDDPRADLLAAVEAIRRFVTANPRLADLMFSQPFADFDPGPEEVAAGSAVRERFVDHVRRCVDAGVVDGDPTDIAHVVVALVQGLTAQEAAGWLGTSKASVSRRWALALDAVLDGLSPRGRRAPAAGSPAPARRTARGSGR
jgi:AcrR family transcriptional regulator